MDVSVIISARLRLDAFQAEDLDAFAAIWSDPVVTEMVGVPARSRSESWDAILKIAGNWAILGYGVWAVRDSASGALLGQVGFFKAMRGHGPEFDDLPEAGWVLSRAAMGQGVGREAATAAHQWFDAHVGGPTVCQIDARNVASQRLAARLGYAQFAEIGLSGTREILRLYRRG